MTPEQFAALILIATAAGAGVKHLMPNIPNRFIPAITFSIVALGGFWSSHWDFSFPNVLATLTAALGPTGAHQLVRSATGDKVKINGQTL